jgi:hypothetical protein
VAVVGGFLGAGKTTLILKAAKILAARGLRVAVVMNDQGDDLVDSELARQSGVSTDQVSGGCFCCRFPDLVTALGRLNEHGADVIFAEAVGSCTDVVATTVLPLLRDYSSQYRIAPLTVLVHERPSGADLEFLFDHQVAEADLVIGRDVHVDAWLDDLLREGVAVGTKPIQVDYARYAEAEAALGWLNARATIRTQPALSPAMVVGPLMEALDEALSAAGIGIVHLKVMDQCESGYLKVALTANRAEPGVTGMLDASPAAEHDLLVNLRALGAPEELRAIVERALGQRPAEWRGMSSFRPSAPVPYHRAGSNSADTAPAGSSITQ